jgi:chromosome segregation ATPase
MKIKIGIIILAAICIGLGIALIATKNQIDDQRKSDADKIFDFSNQVVAASANLDELRQVNLMLTNDLAVSREQTLTLSNNFTETASALTDTKASLQTAQDQITNLDGRISDLEAQNQVLDQRAAALTNNIAALNVEIADTQAKLANSETNNEFLTTELQRRMAEKAELERKFNDLDEVRGQVKKLRDELFVARHLQWMREGTDPGLQQKGAQLLMQHNPPAPAAHPHYDLNVEVGSDGSVHVIPPATNSPAP